MFKTWHVRAHLRKYIKDESNGTDRRLIRHWRKVLMEDFFWRLSEDVLSRYSSWVKELLVRNQASFSIKKSVMSGLWLKGISDRYYLSLTRDYVLPCNGHRPRIHVALRRWSVVRAFLPPSRFLTTGYRWSLGDLSLLENCQLLPSRKRDKKDSTRDKKIIRRPSVKNPGELRFIW